MKDLQVKYTDPLDLIPYENNPRINDYAVKKVMESIKEYGFTNPIIVDADMVIIAGHTRREASILAGLDRVPYIVRDDLTPEQVKAYSKNLLHGCVGEDAEKERRKSGYERCKRNDLSRGDKKSGRSGSRSECYR